jgi:hypothetical protein
MKDFSATLATESTEVSPKSGSAAEGKVSESAWPTRHTTAPTPKLQ